MKPTPHMWIAVAVLAGFAASVAAQSAPTPAQSGPTPAKSAHPPPSGPPTICNLGTCKIDITVNECGASGGIMVDPAYMGMSMTSGPAIIRWKIVTPGYVFSQDGIRFDPANANFQLLPGSPANEIRMRNRKQSKGNFYYFVDVLNCIPVDPFIENF